MSRALANSKFPKYLNQDKENYLEIMLLGETMVLLFSILSCQVHLLQFPEQKSKVSFPA